MPNPLSGNVSVTTIFFYGVVLFLGYLFFGYSRRFCPADGQLSGHFVPVARKARSTSRNTRAAALSTLVVTLLIVGPGLAILTAFVQEARAALSPRTMLCRTTRCSKRGGIGFACSSQVRKRSISEI